MARILFNRSETDLFFRKPGQIHVPYDQGDFAIYTDSPETVVDHCWFRGGWFDPLTIAWESIRKAEVKKVDPVDSDAPGASLYVPFNLKAGEEKIIKVMMRWYIPVSDIRHGGEAKDEDKCDTQAVARHLPKWAPQLGMKPTPQANTNPGTATVLRMCRKHPSIG